MAKHLAVTAHMHEMVAATVLECAVDAFEYFVPGNGRFGEGVTKYRKAPFGVGVVSPPRLVM